MKSPEMVAGTPKSPDQNLNLDIDLSPISISKDWTPEERKDLLTLMKRKIEVLEMSADQLIARGESDSPFLKNIEIKKERIQELFNKLDDNVPSAFLELNRQNFKEFILEN